MSTLTHPQRPPLRIMIVATATLVAAIIVVVVALLWGGAPTTTPTSEVLPAAVSRQTCTGAVSHQGIREGNGDLVCTATTGDDYTHPGIQD